MARKTPEGRFKEELCMDLVRLFPGCVLLKNDEQLLQGVPDLLVLWEKNWAMLEVKKSRYAAMQPNQDYWIERFDQMSFGAFVYPENKEVILRALQSAFGIGR